MTPAAVYLFFYDGGIFDVGDALLVKGLRSGPATEEGLKQRDGNVSMLNLKPSQNYFIHRMDGFLRQMMGMNGPRLVLDQIDSIA